MPKYMVSLFTLYGQHEVEAENEAEAQNMLNYPELDINDPVRIEVELAEEQPDKCDVIWKVSDGSSHWCHLDKGHKGKHRCCFYSSQLKKMPEEKRDAK